ncbi:MAG: penicillin-binding protein 2, partial [Alphaproteobacteria bacterium]|nr:penicillin-binding protein 2 [Alphaproteobacteria bacterium]
PHKNLFAHILGKTNVDNIGISGLEKELNERLTTSDLPLSLSIDAGVQDTIRSKLTKAVEKFNAIGAAAILMDVNTGEILSMISLPDYDPNLNSVPEERALFNFTTKGLYEPGSVLKIFNAAMGLESGKIKLADKFDATKPLKLRYNTIKDYRGENRWLDLQEILIHSSNIGSAQIALKVGKKTQQNFLKNLGFFDTIRDFEVTEKAHPSVPRRWGEETTATVAYGYGISLTPLHLISAFSAVVNGGIYHTPTLLKKETPDKGKKVMSTDTSKKMRELLRGVVVKGSGKRANVAGYEVAGKTGTAQKLVNGRYIDKKVMTSFMATFPVSAPRYALFVMMDEPKASKETFGFATSGWNTVPTAGEIITAIAPQLNVQANYDIDDKRAKMIEASYKE